MNEVNSCLYIRREKSGKYIVLDIILCVIILIIIAEFMFASSFSRIYVVESSMYPTLNGATAEGEAGGDYVYIDKNATPTYGDIVVVNTGDKLIIKRVIALGGDTVKLVNGKLKIKYSGDDDFTDVSESYVSPENNLKSERNNYPLVQNIFGFSYLDERGHLVNDNSMFLLGDNRDVSVDSREYGDFLMSSLVGVVTDWSLKYKKINTAVQTFIIFTVPGIFS
jgi:signal peptidase I